MINYEHRKKYRCFILNRYNISKVIAKKNKKWYYLLVINKIME